MSDLVWMPERLISYPLITDLDLSSDGKHVVYAVREPLLTETESKFITHLYHVPVDGGAPVRLTYGPASNIFPRWSPDGRYIAFLSDRDGKRNLYAMRPDGGEAWRLTDVEKDIKALSWSPDGRQLVFTMVPPDTEAKKAARNAKNDPILWDVDHERAGLWVIPFVEGNASPPEPKLLSSPEQHVVGFAWAPDAGAIAFLHRPTPSEDVWPETRLAVVSATQAASPRDLGAVRSIQSICLWHTHGIACVTGTEAASWAFDERVSVFSPGGDRAPTDLHETYDARPYLVGWSGDGEELYVLESYGTSSAIYALPRDGTSPRVIVRDQGYLSLARTDGRGTHVFVAQDVDQPNGVYLLKEGETSLQLLADPTAPDWPKEHLPRTEIMSWQAEDGLVIEALLTYPLDYQEGVAYPTLVIVHGGPMSLFSRSYVAGPGLYPIAAFAERGYAVLRVNPRGSGGYGATFRRANRGDWGGGDYRDIMRGLDLLTARGIADPQRLGIMGWSYGGYMTSWAITQTDRFRAASVGAGVTNLVSMTGTTDITGFLPDYNGCEFWQDLDTYRRQSPLHHVAGVKTPTLIQHGARDARVPLGQGMELYNALKRQGVEVQMVIYPRQEHGPTEPRLIMDIIQRNMDWFDRWVRGQAT